jgi:hypothetical protein
MNEWVMAPGIEQKEQTERDDKVRRGLRTVTLLCAT